MPKITKQMYVIGDKLTDFSCHQNIIKISDLKTLIFSAKDKEINTKYVIYIGQGINDRQLGSLQEEISNSGLSNVFLIKYPKHYQKSTRHLTHKHKTENIMISDPIECGDQKYKCLLMLEDACAEMSDHITGHHIQGMVLIEAARQLVIAVTEKFHISNKFTRKLNFITHSMSTTFHQFVFPLAVSMEYKVLEMRRLSNNNLSSKSLISFIQNKVVTEIEFKFSVIDSDFVSEKELQLANTCIQSHFQSHHLDRV